MYTLILDSSTKKLYVSLISDNRVMYEKYISGKNDHAKNIVSCIDDGLKSLGITVDELTKIVVGYGPGSYTGVRMAITVCKMLSTFKHIDLYTISTLKLMTSGYKGVVKAMIDARRGNAFACINDTINNKYVLEDGLYSYDSLDEYNSEFIIDEENYIVDPIYCINNCDKILQPHLLVPNYLRDTEAERNLK